MASDWLAAKPANKKLCLKIPEFSNMASDRLAAMPANEKPCLKIVVSEMDLTLRILGVPAPCSPFYEHGLTLIPAWISNCIYCSVLDEIYYPSQAFPRWSLEMDKKFHPILFLGCNYLSMLGIKWWCETWTPIDQFYKSQNALVACPKMLHSEQKCTHFCSERSILLYGTGALWDF